MISTQLYSVSMNSNREREGDCRSTGELIMLESKIVTIPVSLRLWLDSLTTKQRTELWLWFDGVSNVVDLVQEYIEHIDQ